MNDKNYRPKGSKVKREEKPTIEKGNCDLLSQIMDILHDEYKLKSYVDPLLKLINEKNGATSTDERLLKLAESYKKRMEELKGPEKNAGTTVPCQEQAQ